MTHDSGHRGGSTQFASESGAEIYDRQLHGLDGARLLDPHLRSALATVACSGAKTVVDIGAGTGPWSREINTMGLRVVALENGQHMHANGIMGNLKD
jgi:2-polyprenyl-3-methyl-5-hydroxy-6-metoxy-1,4-benzoquinol methylase